MKSTDRKKLASTERRRLLVFKEEIAVVSVKPKSRRIGPLLLNARAYRFQTPLANDLN